MLVDTCVMDELMRPAPDPAVLAWAERQQKFSLSVVSYEEILFALRVHFSERLWKWFDSFVADHCEVLPVTAAIARRCALLRGERSQADALIAATAYEHGLALATRNIRDFEGVAIPLINPFEKVAVPQINPFDK